jgi:hypothetical protein
VGTYSAWLCKVKNYGAMARWVSSTTARYFTIDFDGQLFYYANSANHKKVARPIRFRDIVGAEQLPSTSRVRKRRASCMPSSSLTAHQCSPFLLRTRDRTLELRTSSSTDAARWVHALNAGRDAALPAAPVVEESAALPAAPVVEESAVVVASPFRTDSVGHVEPPARDPIEVLTVAAAASASAPTDAHEQPLEVQTTAMIALTSAEFGAPFEPTAPQEAAEVRVTRVVAPSCDQLPCELSPVEVPIPVSPVDAILFQSPRLVSESEEPRVDGQLENAAEVVSAQPSAAVVSETVAESSPVLSTPKLDVGTAATTPAISLTAVPLKMMPAAAMASTQALPELRITRSGVQRSTVPRRPGTGDGRLCVGPRGQAKPLSGSAVATIRAAVGATLSVGVGPASTAVVATRVTDASVATRGPAGELEPCGWDSDDDDDADVHGLGGRASTSGLPFAPPGAGLGQALDEALLARVC